MYVCEVPVSEPPLPTLLAVIEHVPGPNTVRIPAFMTHGPSVDKVTGLPDWELGVSSTD